MQHAHARQRRESNQRNFIDCHTNIAGNARGRSKADRTMARWRILLFFLAETVRNGLAGAVRLASSKTELDALSSHRLLGQPSI